MQRPGIQLPSRELCANTDVYLTPGFGVDDLSVVVRNVRDFGTISIVGRCHLLPASRVVPVASCAGLMLFYSRLDFGLRSYLVCA